MKRYGLQLYTIRNYTEDDTSCEEALRKVKDMGYETVQLAGSLDVIRRCVKFCEKLDIPVCGILSGWATCQEHSDELISLLNHCGGKDLGMSNMTTEKDVMLEFIDFANKLAEKTNKNGMTLSYHNHSTEFVRTEDGSTLMDLLQKKLNKDLIYFMPDIFWLQHAGVDVKQFIADNSERIKLVHLKDMQFFPKGPDFAALGEGNMDIAGIVKTAENCGIQDFIVEQDYCKDCDPMNAIKTSIDFLKNLK